VDLGGPNLRHAAMIKTNMNWQSFSLPSDPNYGKSTSSLPTFNVSNEQLRSPGAICTSSVQANVAKEPGTLPDFWVHHCHVKDIERLVLYEGYPEFILMVWLIWSFCL
jgi:hypothetical protein